MNNWKLKYFVFQLYQKIGLQYQHQVNGKY